VIGTEPPSIVAIGILLGTVVDEGGWPVAGVCGMLWTVP
jgi:hypothetical protein